jgi:MGT family glycosyltransferase
MRRFLFTFWPFPGHLHPNIAIAHALKERGNEVAFYTGTQAKEKIEGEGFAFFPFRQVDERHIDSLVFSQDRVPSLIRKPFRMIDLYRAWLLDTVPDQVTDLERIIGERPPDVLVCDPTFWGPFLILREKVRFPVAISSFIPGCMIPGPDAPPWGFGLPRPRGVMTRLAARAVEAASEAILTGFRRDVNRMRGRYGLSPLPGSVNALTGRVPLHLIPSVPELDYERTDLPSCVRYVGPCVWNRGRNERPPAWLDRIPRDRPWVHVTEGTMHAQAPFVLQAAGRGLANLPMQVIMTTGKDRDPSKLDLGPRAPNIRVERWVPHSDLLPLTDVLVTTGGASTVLAGLATGVPMVIVPTQWDKPDNAQRVVEAGAGLRLSPRRCTPARLRAAVERVLAEPSFRTNAQRMASVFSGYGGARMAAELLEGLCI